MRQYARVLVTGASGMVGQAVAMLGASKGLAIRATARRQVQGWPAGVVQYPSPELGPAADWSAALTDIDLVVHCAARVHLMNDTAADPLAEFRRVNTTASIELARQAAAAGVRRLVFVSTVFVNGSETHGKPLQADGPAAPASPYAISKHEAEEGLRDIARATGLELVIVRPPLVYGPGARGNFGRLVQALRLGLPLPLGAVQNRRSLIGLDNLADFILLCATHPTAAGEAFLVSDGEDLSTAELLRRTAAAMDRTAHLLPLPPSLLEAVAGALGKREWSRRLLGSLQVDLGKTRAMLGWEPVLGVDEGLRRAVNKPAAGNIRSRSA